MGDNSPLMTVAEAARVLRVSESALRDWMRHHRYGQPRVPHVRLGRREWVEQIVTGTTQPPGGGPRAA